MEGTSLPARMRPVLADALRSEPEIAATLRTVFPAACSVEPSMRACASREVSERSWWLTSSYLATFTKWEGGRGQRGLYL